VNTTIALIVTPFILISFMFAPFAAFTGTIVMIVGALTGVGVIIAIVLIIAIGISYIKLILKLFEAFLSIIINLIFAPIILLGNVMPGSTAFSTWMLSIVGNLAVFPTAVFFLTLSYALMVQPLFGIIKALLGGGIPGVPTVDLSDLSALLGVNELAKTGGIWSPPMTFSFGQGAQGDMMLAAIGLGLLMMSSKYVDMVRDALKVPPFKYGSAIGEALKFGTGANKSWADKGYAIGKSGSALQTATEPISNKLVAAQNASPDFKKLADTKF
jgi:hypothetical protein